MHNQHTPHEIVFLQTAYVWNAKPAGTYLGGLMELGYPPFQLWQQMPYYFRPEEQLMKARQGFAVVQGIIPGTWTHRQDWYLCPLGMFVLGPWQATEQTLRDRFSAQLMFQSNYGPVWELFAVNGYPLPRCILEGALINQEETASTWHNLVQWYYATQPPLQNPYWLSV